MTRWVARFEDRPDGADIRARFSEAHQAYLRANKGRIVLAGPLRLDAEGAAVGGMWIFEAESRAEVEAIIAEDPFQREGLRSLTQIHAWGTAPGYEDVAIAPRS